MPRPHAPSSLQLISAPTGARSRRSFSQSTRRNAQKRRAKLSQAAQWRSLCRRLPSQPAGEIIGLPTAVPLSAASRLSIMQFARSRPGKHLADQVLGCVRALGCVSSLCERVLDPLESSEPCVAILLAEGSGDDHTNARLALGDHGEDDGRGKDTLLKELCAEGLGVILISQHNGNDRRLRVANVEAELHETYPHEGSKR